MVVFECFDPQPEFTKEEVAALKKSVKQLPPLVPTDAKQVFSCIYDKNCTELYKAIENCKWSTVAHFLDTGSWLGVNLLPDFSPVEQTISVVTRLDDQSFVLWSRLPVHLAILQAAPLQIIGRLIDLAPETIAAPDHKGDLPLHLAMYANSADEVLAYLLQNYPSAMNVKNGLGYTPLECATKVSKNAHTSRRAKIIETFMKRGPLKRMTPKGTGFSCDYDHNCSPLYKKIEQCEWLSVADFLETGYWESPNWFSDFVLNLFSVTTGKPESNPNEQAKTVVIRRDEKATIVWARLPLHRALIAKAPLGVIRPLVDAYPKSVTIQDHNGMLPLHLALYYGVDDRIIEFLLERAPKATSVYGMDMKDPVQIALDGTFSHRGEVLRFYIENYRVVPEAVEASEEPREEEPKEEEPIDEEPKEEEPLVEELKEENEEAEEERQ